MQRGTKGGPESRSRLCWRREQGPSGRNLHTKEHVGRSGPVWRRKTRFLPPDHALSHVLLKSRRHAERHLAETTLENVFAHSAVGFHVPRQLAALRAAVSAHLTLVRLFSCVTSPVHCQVGAILEDLAAELASIVAASRDQIFSRLRVENCIKPSLLCQRLDSTWFDGGEGAKTSKSAQAQFPKARPSPSSEAASSSPEASTAKKSNVWIPWLP